MSSTKQASAQHHKFPNVYNPHVNEIKQSTSSKRLNSLQNRSFSKQNMIGAYGSQNSKDSSEYRLQKHMSGEAILPVANSMSEKRSKGKISFNASQNANDETDL